jgi:hypothetical protein
MISPVVEDVMLTAAVKPGSYPSSRMRGVMTPPMAEAAATAEPDSAPKSMAETMFTNASPPGSVPTRALAKSMMRRAMPPRFMIWPARMKNGIARRTNESVLAIFWATRAQATSGL